MDQATSPLDYETRRFGRTPRGQRMNQRERAIAQGVLTRLPSNSLVVDVPCGLGRFSDIIIGQGHRYLGIDLDFASARRAAGRMSVPLPTLQASIFDLPLAKNAAGLVFSIRMFHHFFPDQIERALREMARVAPQCLVTFYNRRTWRIQRRRFSPRIRLKEWRGGEPWAGKSYSTDEMAALARKAGLRIKEKIPGHLFSSNHFLWLERL